MKTMTDKEFERALSATFQATQARTPGEHDSATDEQEDLMDREAKARGFNDWHEAWELPYLAPEVDES